MLRVQVWGVGFEVGGFRVWGLGFGGLRLDINGP